MEQIQSPEELMDKIEKMNRDNSVCQILIPGKGKFTIVLQEEDFQSVAVDVESDKKLKQMIQDSRESYKKGNAMTTTDFIKSLSPKDFA